MGAFKENGLWLYLQDPHNGSYNIDRILDLRATAKKHTKQLKIYAAWPPPAPGVGPVERYVVRGRAVAGGGAGTNEAVEFAVGAARAPGAGRRPPRRDFCANEAVDRGVALRRHLNLPPPPCPSTLVHGLAPATTYRFAVSCVCAVDGELRESPPSLRSRPLEVPAVPACVEIKFHCICAQCCPCHCVCAMAWSFHATGLEFPT